MGLVNLKQIQIAFFGLEKDKIEQAITICKANAYKSLYTCVSIPEVITTLKTKQINALIFDPQLGATDVKEFISAIKKSFPKTHLVALTEDMQLKEVCKEQGVGFYISNPINSRTFMNILQNIAMEVLGIKASQVGIVEEEDF